MSRYNSNHEGPIFPNLAKDLTVDGPDQLWVSDITFVAIAAGFVYLAVILDAWSRRVVGYALGRTMEARLTVAALQAAIDDRRPKPGCVHHSDRGVQYASELYRRKLVEHGLRGSMGRRGNPYDNAKAESFMKTLKVEAVYRMDYERSMTSPTICHASSTKCTMREGYIPHSAIGARCSSRSSTPTRVSKRRPEPVHPAGVTPTSGRLRPALTDGWYDNLAIEGLVQKGVDEGTVRLGQTPERHGELIGNRVPGGQRRGERRRHDRLRERRAPNRHGRCDRR